MLPFLAKTWPLWWAISIPIVLRWFHLLFNRQATGNSEALIREEDETYSGDLVLQQAQVVSLPDLQRAF
jgi:hypothetical protein